VFFGSLFEMLFLNEHNNRVGEKVKENMKMKKTHMLNLYIAKFALRISIFIAVIIFYILRKEEVISLMSQPIWRGFTAIHGLWCIFMIMMIGHLFPNHHASMAIKKSHEQEYEANEGYSELELYRYVQKQNIKAWQIMLFWLSFNAVFGTLYLFGIMDEADLLMLTVFYFICDYICILFYCPFQSIAMKNKCCVNCRIYDWGHFMMFTPMLFIKNFFSWSLFFTSIVVLIKWEYIYARYPERFWSGSNKRLQCANCNDRICQLKKK
jgi:hypothetical protein